MQKSVNALFVIIILILSISTSNLAIAQSYNESSTPTLSIKTNLPSYNQGDTVIVTGHVSKVQNGTSILLRVFNPVNLLISSMTLSPSSDGNFNKTFLALGPVWNKIGNYTIETQYGKYTETNSTFYFSIGGTELAQGSLTNLYDRPPLKQIELGTSPKDVICKQGFVLILKMYSDSPACVKPQTAQILVERGWGMMISTTSSGQIGSTYLPNMIKVSNANFTIYYDITSGTITSIKQNIQSRSFIISVQTKNDGSLTIQVPRAFFDAKIQEKDVSFYILEDGQQTDYDEIEKTPTYRTEKIPFKQGTEEIEFIATQI